MEYDPERLGYPKGGQGTQVGLCSLYPAVHTKIAGNYTDVHPPERWSRNWPII
jgi:hypothetical protein